MASFIAVPTLACFLCPNLIYIVIWLVQVCEDCIEHAKLFFIWQRSNFINKFFCLCRHTLPIRHPHYTPDIDGMGATKRHKDTKSFTKCFLCFCAFLWHRFFMADGFQEITVGLA